VDFGAHRQRTTCEQFRRCVFRSQPARGGAPIAKRLGQPEVDQVGVVVLDRHDDVGGFDVAVEQPGAVNAREFFGGQGQPTQA
jgi:hypothetical protein